MKNIIVVIAVIGMGYVSIAQTPFKAAFNNSPENTIDISLSNDEIIIVGTTSNEITIESIGTRNPDYGTKVIKEEPKETSKRADGLKPINSKGADNTGLGITFEKLEGYAKISSNVIMSSNKIKITIPNKVKIIINDIMPHGETKTKYSITDMNNEIIVTSLNADFSLNQITGPLVLNATNGSAEIKYSSLSTDKPISIVTINGFVDLTLPASAKANIQIQSMNGEAYTDFEIESEEDMPTMNFPGMEMFMLNGKINGGGNEINIHSINGDIYIRKGK